MYYALFISNGSSSILSAEVLCKYRMSSMKNIDNYKQSIHFRPVFLFVSSKLCTHPLVFEPNDYERRSTNCSTQYREKSALHHLTVIPAALLSFMDGGRRLLSAFSRTLAVYFCFFWAMFEQLFEILKGEALRLLQPSAPPVAACYGRTSNPSSCLIHWSDVSCYFSYKTTFGGLFSCDVTIGKTRIWRL